MKNVSVLFITTIVILAACNPATPEDKDSAIQTAIAQTQAAEGNFSTMVAQTFAASIPTAIMACRRGRKGSIFAGPMYSQSGHGSPSPAPRR